MSLLPLLASLVMAGAGVAALAAIALTWRSQLPAVRKLLADSRAIAADRAFLVTVIGVTQPAAPRAVVRLRRQQTPAARTMRSVVVLPPLRAAA